MGFCLCGLVLLLLLPIGNSSSFFNIISFELVFGHFFFGFCVLFFYKVILSIKLMTFLFGVSISFCILWFLSLTVRFNPFL
jgi:hypothetical protein